ncbi:MULTISPECIES: rhomboid-like protein [Streptacidiphilus]|uniref:Rhomboid-like protein n=1 Tax=Streptacidiphilus cavernicola TaxID=3342716 RepID=A0ABV6UHU4_9ACTN|nr:rhomboid-like protein [Streptacidiphilus jeojiense]
MRTDPLRSSRARLLRWAAGYPRRNPAAFGYLLLLAVDAALLRRVLSESDGVRLRQYISTNLDNMGQHPLRSLFGSLLVVDTGDALSFFLVVVVGLAVCLAVLERSVGTRRAVALVLVAHVGATLTTTAVISVAVGDGAYPQATRHALDYGVSYVSIAAVAAVTPLLPRRLRPWWAGAAVLYPLSDAEWYGALPDFTTIGHCTAALIGLAGARIGGVGRGRPTSAAADGSHQQQPPGAPHTTHAVRR